MLPPPPRVYTESILLLPSYTKEFGGIHRFYRRWLAVAIVQSAACRRAKLRRHHSLLLAGWLAAWLTGWRLDSTRLEPTALQADWMLRMCNSSTARRRDGRWKRTRLYLRSSQSASQSVSWCARHREKRADRQQIHTYRARELAEQRCGFSHDSI